MEYRNKRTGVIFSSNCVCKGEDWEVVVKATPEKPIKETPKKKETKKNA